MEWLDKYGINDASLMCQEPIQDMLHIESIYYHVITYLLDKHCCALYSNLGRKASNSEVEIGSGSG